jgi:mannan endo-1,4-beta-mannosidase
MTGCLYGSKNPSTSTPRDRGGLISLNRKERQDMSAILIVSQSSGKVLDVPGSSSTNGTRIQQFTSNGNANQRWQFVHVGSGLWKIVSESSGKVLDVPGFSTTDGTQIQQFTDNGGSNQRWRLVPVPSGGVKIVSEVSDKVLDVPGFSTTDGTQIQQFTDNGGSNQRWKLISVSSGADMLDRLLNESVGA